MSSDVGIAVKARERTRNAQLQVILDNVKDAILTLDAAGRIASVNRTAERLFGCTSEAIVGQSIETLLPVAGRQSVTGWLEELSRQVDDTQHDLSSREADARHVDGSWFPAEIAVSRTSVGSRVLFILCLRDIAARKQSEQALRDSEARYRTLVENAPEIIVVLDVEHDRLVDVNENAARFFRMSRAALLKCTPYDLSPPHQPDGKPSFGVERGHIKRALAGEAPVFEWLHKDSCGNELPCEIRLVRLPAAHRELIRASIIDITERKRAEQLAAGEKKVLERIAANARLQETLSALVETADAALPGAASTVMLLDESGGKLWHAASRGLPEGYMAAVDGIEPGEGTGSFGLAVFRRGVAVVSDIERDASWAKLRELASRYDIRACWSMPIVSGADDRTLGAFSVYYRTPRSPAQRDIELLGRLTQLAGIAIDRKQADESLRSSEARFRGLFENVAAGLYHTTFEGELLSANPALVAMLGYDSEQELREAGPTVAHYVDPRDRDRLMRKLKRHGEVHNFEYRLKCKDGSVLDVLENVRALHDEQGNINGYLGTINDITERKQAECARFEEKERAEVTLKAIGDGVITTDAAGIIDYLNPMAESLTGWQSREARGRLIGEVFRLSSEAGEAQNTVLRCLQEKRPITLAEPSLLVDREGNETLVQDTAAPIRDRDGRLTGVVMVFHDVGRDRRLRRQLSYQARHDALTGLINRHEFENRLADALVAARTGSPAESALLYLDLDQFKVVNDTSGHGAGDQLIRQVTTLLQAQVRARDTIARLGGDEFGLLLEGCAMPEAVRIAEGLRRAIRDYRFVWEERAFGIGVSIGIVAITPETASAQSAMSAADVACYTAKDLGRNRLHVYQAGDTSERHKEMQWVSRLTQACEEDRFELFFQPIVPIGATPGGRGHYELLLRMRDAQGQAILPSEFIPAAERYNLMSTLDRWVVRHALEHLAQRPDAEPHESYTLAINLSGNSLSDDDFLHFVTRELETHCVAPGSICFEITETAAIANLGRVVHFMNALRKLGCLFSLDDFGSGLSSFAYLKSLPVDFLKIDGYFIKNVSRDRIDHSMVEAISKIGRSMGIKTIAERVEDGAVLETLAKIGVEYAQGFHIARPKPAAGFAAFANGGCAQALKLA
ncbi:MAG TPA: PAS domain S-box protein [Gammaproteobacteria bacterium]|nr:PAS domain S-box protein [Gammaproteobacteria bacterium]